MAAVYCVPVVLPAGALLIVHPMQTTSINIQRALSIKEGWMTAEELTWLADQASKHEVIVEVGSYQGRSTRAMGDSAKGVVYAVDDWKGLRTVDTEWWTAATPKEERETLFERFTGNVKDLIYTGKIKVVISDHAKVAGLPFPKMDMVFIDGDHSYAGVKRDIETWLPLLNDGGILCGHDCNQEQIMRAVNELLPGNKVAIGLIWEWEKP